MPRRKAKGIAESVRTTAGNKFTVQVLTSGQRVYRKNGKFTSARAYRAAKGAPATVQRPGYLQRTPGPTDFRPRSLDFVRRDNTAGADASKVLPYLKKGDPLTKVERDTLYTEFRMQRAFLGFWNRPANEGASREVAEARFLKFMDALQQAQNAMERNEIRIEFLGTGTNLETVIFNTEDDEEDELAA